MGQEFKSRVLLVEDDEAILELMRELLESENYLVDVAFNGKEALDHLRSGKPLPSLILLDLMMPVLDGPGFRMEQRKDPQLKDIPVVIMSADGHIEKKTQQTMVNGYLKKPVKIESILSTVRQYCQH